MTSQAGPRHSAGITEVQSVNLLPTEAAHIVSDVLDTDTVYSQAFLLNMLKHPVKIQNTQKFKGKNIF